MTDEPVHAPEHADVRPEVLYTSTPPWDIGRPQPAFLALADAGDLRGRILDVGCGTGEHVLMAAGLGLDTTGVDLAANALRAAGEKARGRGLAARFLRCDALRLPELGDTFDTVLDSLFFHTVDAGRRAAYADSVRSALKPGGRYFMLGFSDRQPGETGRVHKLTLDDITAAFTDGWRIDSIEPTTIDSTIHRDRIRGWLVSATRI